MTSEPPNEEDHAVNEPAAPHDDDTTPATNTSCLANDGPLERTTHSFDLDPAIFADNNPVTTLSLVLDGRPAVDAYATNLEWTGETNWYGSYNLCTWLGSVQGWQTLQHSHRILELGSGLGRAGILATKLLHLQHEQQEQHQQPHAGHNKQIVLTDGEPRVLEWLRHNCHLNQLTITPNNTSLLSLDQHNHPTTPSPSRENESHSSSRVQLHVGQLWWGPNEPTLKPFLSFQSKKEEDNPNPPHPSDDDHHKGTFDLILGADVLYRLVAHELFWTVAQLLKRPQPTSTSSSTTSASGTQPTTTTPPLDNPNRNNGGVFYLAYSKRNTYTEQELLDVAAQYGLHGHKHDDYCIDIWDNSVDPDCELWRDAIFVFGHQPQQEQHNEQQEQEQEQEQEDNEHKEQEHPRD